MADQTGCYFIYFSEQINFSHFSDHFLKLPATPMTSVGTYRYTWTVDSALYGGSFWCRHGYLGTGLHMVKVARRFVNSSGGLWQQNTKLSVSAILGRSRYVRCTPIYSSSHQGAELNSECILQYRTDALRYHMYHDILSLVRRFNFQKNVFKLHEKSHHI